MMLFACGVGVGLFFYGVAEPIYHYTSRNRYSADPTLPDNELAQIAINLPMYHWGMCSFVAYLITSSQYFFTSCYNDIFMIIIDLFQAFMVGPSFLSLDYF